jgi:chromosome segregation ATPase
MSKSSSHSTKFTRAARAEGARLLRHQERAGQEIDRLEAQLADARREFTRIADRVEQLRTIAGELTAEPAPEPAPAAAGTAISGAEIRRVAVKALLDSGEAGRPIHYREWLALLERDGYRVEGKRPDAVFLGQIARSPVVRSTTQAGFYALDLEARERLSRQIAAAQKRFLDLSSAGPRDVKELDRVIEERDDASAEVRKLQRELSEVLAVLGEADERRPGPISKAAA